MAPAQQSVAAVTATASVEWDAAFQEERADRPLHFTARYLDGTGQVHRLEEWRLGRRHLRRKTDDRIDLHADAVVSPNSGRPIAEPLDYVWQIVDLQKRIDHTISTAGMLHLGMLYSYYSMAHVLTRPAGRFTVHPADAPSTAQSVASPLLMSRSDAAPEPCTWWQIDAPAQPSLRVCWLRRYGVPLRTWSQTGQGWRLDFQVDTLSTQAIPQATFKVDTRGLQVRSVDELEAED